MKKLKKIENLVKSKGHKKGEELICIMYGINVGKSIYK